MSVVPLRISHAGMSPAPASPDSGEPELIARARRGDVDAFEGLYRQTAGRVYAICLRMTGDTEQAKELLQDVFVRVWERLGSYRGEAAFTSWLHRLTVNVVLATSRADRRRDHRVGALPADPDAPAVGDGGTRADSVGHRIDLEAAIAALPPGARRVFVLHDIEGYRHDEIARLTGTAPGTVRAQLHRARKLLMEALGR